MTPTRIPWTNVYGAARTLLALGLSMTLAFSGTDVLFEPTVFETLHAQSPAGRWSLFFLAREAGISLGLVRWVCVVLLLVIASGWRPRWTAALHWWMAFSFAVSTTVTEGGDQIGAILTLLLLPVALTDPRRSHWTPWPDAPLTTRGEVAALVAASSLLMIRLQVAVIYFHAAVGKMYSPEWADGTAVYYWFTHPVYGMAGPVKALAEPILTSGLGVALLTWGTIILELALASALVMDRSRYSKLLFVGIGFHFGIVLAHGLVSFFFAMSAALILYLRPADMPFRPVAPARWPDALSARLRAVQAWAGSRPRMETAVATPSSPAGQPSGPTP